MAEVRTRNRAPAQFGGRFFKTPLVGDTGWCSSGRRRRAGSDRRERSLAEQESDCAAAALAR
jgi:hypothetical protein